ncbi:MAG: RagB/SusD family nutrient uptake outer membrane protein [Bacteroidota bacterium]
MKKILLFLKNQTCVIFLLMTGVSAFIFTGCNDDLLDIPTQPGEQTDVTTYESVEGMNHLLNQAYSAYAEYFASPSGGAHFPVGHIVFGSIRSDDAWAGGEFNEVSPRHEINEYRLFSDNIVLKEIWNQCYLSIRYCNVVIDNAHFTIEKNPSSEPEISNFIAQAHVLRALGYFMLARTFGDVPLLLKAGVIENVPRDPVEDVYKQAIKDLNNAISSGDLKSKQEIPDELQGQVSIGTAYSFLAKTYMYLASVDKANAMEHFQSAYNAAKTVISSGEFQLLNDYSELWKQENKFTSESVFEIGYPNFGVQRLHHHWWATMFRPRYIYTLGSRDYQPIDGNRGWGFNTPTQDFVNAFEEGDPRLHWTVWMQGDSTTGLSSDGLKHEICFAASRTGYYYRKTTIDQHFNSDKSFSNLKLYRYADLLLIGAEAANEIGETTDALSWLNSVRERARNTVAAYDHEDDKIDGVPADVTTTDQAQLRDIIRNERRVELGCEGERFFDLARWHGTHGYDIKQIIESAYKIPGPDYSLTTNVPAVFSESPRSGLDISFELPKHLVAPIPKGEIELTNGVLVQNPGY